MLIVIAAAVLHYLMWAERSRGRGPGGTWDQALDYSWPPCSSARGSALYLIVFAVRGLKMWVLTYPTGLFVWHRGRVLAFPWDEVRAVQIAGLPDKAALNRPADDPDAFWYDLTRSGHRVFGTTLTLTRADGEQVALPSTLGDFAALGRRVQEETYRRLFPVAWADFQAGQPAAFGPVMCSLAGVTIGKETLPWAGGGRPGAGAGQAGGQEGRQEEGVEQGGLERPGQPARPDGRRGRRPADERGARRA